MDYALDTKTDLKVVVLGASNAGKTTLIRSYKDLSFNSGQIWQATVGFDVMHRKWGPYNVHIWDTAGQEKFYSFAPSWLRNSDAVVLVYDVTNYQSFQQLGSHFLPLVADQTNLRVVVGHKIDLVKDRPSPVPTEEARRFAEEINRNCLLSEEDRVPFFQTSSKSGDGVQGMFDYVFETCLSKQSDLYRESQANLRDSIILGAYNEGSREGNGEDFKSQCCRK